MELHHEAMMRFFDLLGIRPWLEIEDLQGLLARHRFARRCAIASLATPFRTQAIEIGFEQPCALLVLSHALPPEGDELVLIEFLETPSGEGATSHLAAHRAGVVVEAHAQHRGRD